MQKEKKVKRKINNKAQQIFKIKMFNFQDLIITAHI